MGCVARDRGERHAGDPFDDILLRRERCHRADRGEIWRRGVVRAPANAARSSPCGRRFQERRGYPVRGSRGRRQNGSPRTRDRHLRGRRRAPRLAEGRHATGVLYGYWEGLSADEYRWWFKPGVSMGSIPTNDGATCVFVSVPSARFRGEIRGNAALAYTRLIWQISRRFAERLHDSVRVE